MVSAKSQSFHGYENEFERAGPGSKLVLHVDTKHTRSPGQRFETIQVEEIEKKSWPVIKHSTVMRLAILGRQARRAQLLAGVTEDFGIAPGMEPFAFVPHIPERCFMFALGGKYYLYDKGNMLRFDAEFGSHDDFRRRLNDEPENMTEI
ncbi:hypothetical protein B0H19DRAFT_1063436 [Mycena capillaripes]|nr:hypothetical protein B0H19DRAFT_1063436 [Mycena capillaripes]